MRRLLLLLPVVGLLVFSGLLTAGATVGECATFENHSGHIPGSYDYAEFYEDGQLVTTVDTNGEDTFVDPAQWDAGQSWDVVKKCVYGDTTTTTISEETTTTLVETTTTTAPVTTTVPETTTTAPETTTLPPDHGSFWSASSTCSTLTAEWGEGIVQVNVTQRLAEGDFEVNPFLESGQVLSVESALAGSEWILVPVVETGFVPVPEQISLFTEVCTPTTVPSAPPELPFTGPAGWVGLLVAAVASVGIGSVLVREFRTTE